MLSKGNSEKPKPFTKVSLMGGRSRPPFFYLTVTRLTSNIRQALVMYSFQSSPKMAVIEMEDFYPCHLVNRSSIMKAPVRSLLRAGHSHSIICRQEVN
jgi:hypothetical protein